MDRQKTQALLTGCYIPIPSLFRDADLELNLPGIRKHVRFLLDGGVRTGNAVLLTCGAAGDFTTLNTDERLRVCEAVLEEAGGRVGVILGVQSTNLREIVYLARAAERLGVCALQVCPPFYHQHTDEDVHEFMGAVGAASDLGLVVYTTYWQYKVSLDMICRLAEMPKVVAFKWSAPSVVEFERGLRLLGSRTLLIDNQLQFVMSHMLGARGINTHPSNYWPEWGVRLWSMLEAGQYRRAQETISKVVSPYYDLGTEVERFTGGEGHIDKLCLELIGLDSSRCRPPIRDIRPHFRDKARKMLQACGVPHCV